MEKIYQIVNTDGAGYSFAVSDVLVSTRQEQYSPIIITDIRFSGTPMVTHYQIDCSVLDTVEFYSIASCGKASFYLEKPTYIQITGKIRKNSKFSEPIGVFMSQRGIIDYKLEFPINTIIQGRIIVNNNLISSMDSTGYYNIQSNFLRGISIKVSKGGCIDIGFLLCCMLNKK